MNKQKKLQCPKCHSINVVKKGFTPAGTQRYLCNKCKNRFVLDENKNIDQENLIQTLEKVKVKKMNTSCESNCKCKEYIKKSKSFKLQTLVRNYLQNVNLCVDVANKINELLYDPPYVYDMTKHDSYFVLNKKDLKLGQLNNIIQATGLFYDVFSDDPIKHINGLIEMIGDTNFDTTLLKEMIDNLKNNLNNQKTNFQLIDGCEYLNQFNNFLEGYYQNLESIYIRLMDFVEE